MKIRVTTHTGDDDIIEVVDYNAEEITRLRNDNEVQSIQIGNLSYSRIDIKLVKPVEETVPEV